MIEAAFKAFARALRVAVSIDPEETGVPSTKGTLSRVTRRHRDPRLRDGQPALGREGAGARRRDGRRSTADADEVRAADGLILPGVGAFPRAMERIRELGLDELIAERPRRRRRRCSASASACSCSSTRPTELGGAEGLGLLAGRGRPSSPADGLKVPHIGWAPVALGARVAARPRASTRRRRSTSSTPSSPRPTPAETARQRRVRRALRLRGRARQRLRRPVPPREVERRRPAAARELRRDLRRSAGAGVILYPAIDIRGGQAVRLLQGDYDRETAYDADPVDAAKRWADGGAEYLHVVDLDGAKAGEPREPRDGRADRRRGRVPDPGRRRAARRRRGRRGAARPARTGS